MFYLLVHTYQDKLLKCIGLHILVFNAPNFIDSISIKGSYVA